MEFAKNTIPCRNIESSSVAGVIRVTGKNCKCAIELLSQNHACQGVSQSERAQRKQQHRPFSRGFRPAIGRSDGENNLLSTVIPQTAEPFGKLFLRSSAVPGYPAIPKWLERASVACRATQRVLLRCGKNRPDTVQRQNNAPDTWKKGPQIRPLRRAVYRYAPARSACSEDTRLDLKGT